MLESGERVLYGMHGICNVIGIEKRTVDRKIIEYYVLEPMEQPGARFYVPTHNQSAVVKLQPILSKNQLDELLKSDAAQVDMWIPDEKQRKQHYRELIHSGDRAALISMVGSLLRHKEKQSAVGRKVHLCDENFLRDAQKLLCGEFSVVLGIPPEEVGNYVSNIICK